MGKRPSELDRLRGALERVMEAPYIAVWLETPNEAFGGLTPLEAFQLDSEDVSKKVAEMVYRLESGEPT